MALPEAIINLAEKWFGAPVRALSTIMLSAAVMLALHQWAGKWFSNTIADHFWRWPLLALVLSASGLLTYVLESAYKFLDKASAKRKATGVIVHLVTGLDSEQRQLLRDIFVSRYERCFTTPKVDILVRRLMEKTILRKEIGGSVQLICVRPDI